MLRRFRNSTEFSILTYLDKYFFNLPYVSPWFMTVTDGYILRAFLYRPSRKSQSLIDFRILTDFPTSQVSTPFDSII